jgi:superfamily I DNA and/or RNA helicase
MHMQVQYRSHPALMAFINQQFYSGMLSNGVAAADRPAPPGFPFPAPSVPIVFVAVDGQEKTNARGSKLNEKVSGSSHSCLCCAGWYAAVAAL